MKNTRLTASPVLEVLDTPYCMKNWRASSQIMQHLFFHPLVVETFRGWDADAVKFLKDIAYLDARRWAKNDAIEIKRFFKDCCLAARNINIIAYLETFFLVLPTGG